jgi:hypothetical protein
MEMTCQMHKKKILTIHFSFICKTHLFGFELAMSCKENDFKNNLALQRNTFTFYVEE